jgi:protein TonB
MAVLVVNGERSLSLWLAGCLSGILGSLSVLALLLWINLTAKSPPRTEATRAVPLEIAPAPPKSQAKPKPKPRKTKAAKRLQSVAPPNLAANLSGIDFSLPDLAFDAGADQHLLGTAENEEESFDTPPQPVVTSNFAYPPQAKKANLQGYVLLSVLVNEQGEVVEAQVLESSPPGVFEQSALEGIRRWRFNPAQSKGKPVATWVQQKIVFQLG